MSAHKTKRNVAKTTTTLLGNLIRALSNNLSSDLFVYKSKLTKDNLTIGQRSYSLEYISSGVVLITPSKAYKADNSYCLDKPTTLKFDCLDSAYGYLTTHLERI